MKHTDIQKEKKAIARLKAFEPADGYRLAYSGGKDSDCIKILAQLAGVKFEAVHNLTTVDAPETMRYIKSQPDIRIEKAYDNDGNHITMWNLIVKKLMPPTRLLRYCCDELKERSGSGKVLITGVRWAESSNRKNNSGVVQVLNKPKHTQKFADKIGAEYHVSPKGGIILNNDNDNARRLVEHCYAKQKTMIVMREVFKRDKPLDNGSGAVSLCVFHSNVKPDEYGALTVTPTKDYCRRCAFYKTHEDFDRGLGDAARSLREKGIEPVKKMDYDGKQYMSVRPIGKENDDDNERGV